MIRAIRIHENGGPEVMRWESIRLPAPAAGEVRVRHTAIAVNFSDVNVRRGGFYLSAAQVFPLIPGNEAAGVVAGLGAGVTGFGAGGGRPISSQRMTSGPPFSWIRIARVMAGVGYPRPRQE